LLLPVPLLLVDLAWRPGDVPTTSPPVIAEEREAEAPR
jgi:hypothetical protein